jgi:hypothetical protein
MSLDVYSNVLPEMQSEAAESLDNLLRNQEYNRNERD